MMFIRCAFAFLLFSSLVPCGVVSQFEKGSALEELVLSWAETDLFEHQVTNYSTQPEVEEAYHPNKYQLPLNDYVYSPPDRTNEYTQNVIFDPCRGSTFDCCNMTFGTPEWEVIVADPLAANYGVRRLVYSDGSTVPQGSSRQPSSTLVMDETCTGPAMPAGRVDCIMAQVARGVPLAYPQCWNWNTSVVADAGCRSPKDGTPLALCVELGFLQTLHIVQCGGRFHDDNHCGTFLEIHRPAVAEKLAEVRLPRVDSSGYRMTIMPTTYKQNDTQVLCWDPKRRGAYEVWWVLRTRYNYIIERRVPFAVMSPLCDWDPLLNHYQPYATVATAKRLADFSSAPFNPAKLVFTKPLQWSTLIDGEGKTILRDTVPLDPFASASRLFTQPRSEGVSPSHPGIGMGGTYHPITPHSYDQVGTNQQGGESKYTPDPSPPQIFDGSTYSFTPAIPAYTVGSGTLGPTDEAQSKLVNTIAARGYSRRNDAIADDTLAETWAAARAEEVWSDVMSHAPHSD